MSFWKKLAKIASFAAPIVAAPFTGGTSLALIGAGAGAAGGALSGGGWKGALLGGGLGAIPGVGTSAGKAAGAVTPTLAQGLKQAGTNLAKQQAIGLGTQAVGNLLTRGTPPQGGTVYSNYLGQQFTSPSDYLPSQPRGGFGSFLPQNAGGGGGFGSFLQHWGPSIAGAVSSATAPRSAGGGQTAPAAAGAAPAAGGGWWGKWGPLIGQGAGIVGGIYAGKQATKSAMARSPEEQFALSGAQGLAGEGSAMARELMGQSRPYMQQAGNYYSTLLRGNRAAMQQAIAGPTAQITDVYRGAERGLERSGVRGAARDVAAGDLARARASQIAGLTTGVQPAAAEALAKLGTDYLSAVGPLYGTSANLYSDLLRQGALNRAYGREEGEKTGAAIGGLIRDVGGIRFGKGGTPGAGPVATPPTIPSAPGVPAGLPGGTPAPQAPAVGPRFPGTIRAPWGTPRNPWGNVGFGGGGLPFGGYARY
jgi:hypothetical protein